MGRCLESIDGVDLEEAHEWVRDSTSIDSFIHNVPPQLFLNCTDDELQPHARKLALL